MARLFERWRSTAKVAPNRKLASLRACLAEAWRRNLVVENVARRVKPLPEPSPRQRVLSDDEMHRLLSAINSLPDAYWRAALLLLVQTGARRGEVLSAKWADLDGDVWKLPQSKSGRPQAIPLLPETVKMLEALPRVGEFVIPGAEPKREREEPDSAEAKPRGKRTDLHRPWRTVCRLAGLPDVRLHDVRRTYGLAAAKAVGLHMASRMLRHSTVALTARVYAPFQLEDVREAAEKIAAVRRAKLRVVK